MAKEKRENVLYKAYLPSPFSFKGKSLWLFVKGSGCSRGFSGGVALGSGTLKPSFLGVGGISDGDDIGFSFSSGI